MDGHAEKLLAKDAPADGWPTREPMQGHAEPATVARARRGAYVVVVLLGLVAVALVGSLTMAWLGR